MKQQQQEKRAPKQKYIIPGERMTSVISALPGTTSEQVLREIASPKMSTDRNPRTFGPWLEVEPDILHSTGSVMTESGKKFDLTLIIGKSEGLFLSEVAGSKCSLRHAEVEGTCFTLNVGKGLSETRFGDVANKVVGWVIHGNFWENRPGDVCNHPYGDDPDRPLQFMFKVTDGGKERITLGQFLEKGGIRSSHVGNWRPHTLIAAACGVPVSLHEFVEKSDRTTTFRGHTVSKDPTTVWGPYTRMDASTVASNGFGPDIARLARAAASPFAFHFHATRLRFPNTTLESAHLIGKLGWETLERAIANIASNEPERFYRLIDENGYTHRLKGSTSTHLIFEDGEEFPSVDIVENLEQTLQELARLQDDPGFDLPRIRRVVPDTHFYAVISSLAQADGASVVHELSGAEMYRYLLNDEAQAQMHRVRNERLFRSVRDIFNADQLQLVVFPPITTDVKADQYSLNLETFDKEHWLSKTLEA